MSGTTLKLSEITAEVNTASYEASPIKRSRRSKAEMEELRTRLHEVCEEFRPATVRQIYYQFVSRGYIEKTEADYGNVVCRLLGLMRTAGELPYEWITDSTRWMRKPDSYSSLDAMLRVSASSYRRALWDNQDSYVEIWIEKDALAGVVCDITDEWDVPLMVSRGFSSHTFLYSTAQTIRHKQKPTFLYCLTDCDKAGLNIAKQINGRIHAMAPDLEFHFERLALTPEQVEEWHLPTRPPKNDEDHDCVELDAIPSKTLRRLVESAIIQHIDMEALRKMRLVEAEERRSLQMVARTLFANGPKGA